MSLLTHSTPGGHYESSCRTRQKRARSLRRSIEHWDQPRLPQAVAWKRNDLCNKQEPTLSVEALEALDVWGLINWSSSRSNDATNLQNDHAHAAKEFKLFQAVKTWLSYVVLQLSNIVCRQTKVPIAHTLSLYPSNNPYVAQSAWSSLPWPTQRCEENSFPVNAGFIDANAPGERSQLFQSVSWHFPQKTGTAKFKTKIPWHCHGTCHPLPGALSRAGSHWQMQHVMVNTQP